MKPYQTVSLIDLLSEMDESDIAVRLDSFKCSRDSDREEFLHNNAIAFEKRDMARTYLAIMDDAIAGYFTLSIRCLRVPDDQDISKSLGKKMNIYPDNNVARSYLLGQLGRADFPYKGIGTDLLRMHRTSSDRPTNRSDIA